MPRTTATTPALAALMTAQDNVVTEGQLVAHGVSRNAADKRVCRRAWTRLLPGIFLTCAGGPTRPQQLVAAHLWGGEESAVDGVDALRWHGFDGDVRTDGRVHVVVPWHSPVRSRDFVVVRRSIAGIGTTSLGIVPYVDAPTAAIVAARNAKHLPTAIAILSRALQRGLVTVKDLAEARECIGDKWCAPVDMALVAVGVGVRSPAEDDFRLLVESSRVLPEPAWNQWLSLDDGGPDVCADALWEDAGMVGEVIGKRYHAWAEQYEKTQERKERLQALGVIVCEATPMRIRRRPALLRASLESTWRIHAGRGMPAGVRATTR